MTIGKASVLFFLFFAHASSKIENKSGILFSPNEISQENIQKTRGKIKFDLEDTASREARATSKLKKISRQLFKSYLRDGEKANENFLRKIFRKEYFDFLFLRESRKEIENKLMTLDEIFEEKTGYSRSEFKKLEFGLSEFLDLRGRIRTLLGEIKENEGWLIKECEAESFSKIKPLCIKRDQEVKELVFKQSPKFSEWKEPSKSRRYLDLDFGEGLKISFTLDQDKEVGLRSSSTLGPLYNDELRVFFFWKEHMINLGDFL